MQLHNVGFLKDSELAYCSTEIRTLSFVSDELKILRGELRREETVWKAWAWVVG
jgi:hypothetical protein